MAPSTPRFCAVKMRKATSRTPTPAAHTARPSKKWCPCKAHMKKRSKMRSISKRCNAKGQNSKHGMNAMLRSSKLMLPVLQSKRSSAQRPLLWWCKCPPMLHPAMGLSTHHAHLTYGHSPRCRPAPTHKHPATTAMSSSATTARATPGTGLKSNHPPASLHAPWDSAAAPSVHA